MTIPDRRLWLVRHGETEGQSSIRFHGSNDVPLSAIGREQIRDLLPLLEGAAFSQVLHSPMSRAVESAAILADGLGLDAGLLCADERLREISFGACEGMTRAEIDTAFPTFWSDYEAGRLDAFPDGESRPEFAARIQAAITDHIAGNWPGDLLLVAHRGTVRHALHHLIPQPSTAPNAFSVDLASLSVLRQITSGWQVELLGMRP